MNVTSNYATRKSTNLLCHPTYTVVCNNSSS